MEAVWAPWNSSFTVRFRLFPMTSTNLLMIALPSLVEFVCLEILMTSASGSAVGRKRWSTRTLIFRSRRRSWIWADD
eukprot:Skav219290  [mRNA]  locus=scaffold2157:209872:212955:+ [translate_table: standard]